MKINTLTFFPTSLLLAGMLFLSVILFLTSNELKAQDSLNVIRGESTNNTWRLFSDSHNSLYNHLANEAYNLLEQRSEKIQNIDTLSEWKERQEEVRQTLLDVVGPFPDKSTLNAEIRKTIIKDRYKVEHIIFESQSGFYVTSSLFIPEPLNAEKAPAILYLSGHTTDAYRDTDYQHVILNLVKKGFIVFAIDPVGQGERLEYYDRDTGESLVGGPTSEHSYPGAQAFITGSSQARYMTWDGIRAVDYLLTRKEVDPARIGITGMSGGGTQAAYIAALDDRIYASAPSNYITSFRRLFETIGPQDAEQNLFHAIERGIDHADFLTVRAPKPTLILSTTNDFFSIQGARETAQEVSEIYKAYGKDEYFGIAEDIGGHTVTPKNRKALYAFFQYHLKNPGSSEDEEVEILKNDEIRVTESGQVSLSYDGETVYTLNRLDAERQLEQIYESRKNLEVHIPEVLKSVKRISGYQAPEGYEQPVFTGRFQREGYVLEKYFIKGEGDYPIPYLLMIPENCNGKAIIYLHHKDKAADAGPGGQIEWFVRKGFAVLSPDLIGNGEAGANHNTNELRREWRASILVGRSITGIRAGDVSRLTNLLKAILNIHEIYGVAHREIAPVLLHAAAFNSDIKRVALVGPLISYRSLVMNRFYHTGFVHSTVAGSLKAYDLPDLAAGLAPRKLMIANGLNELGEVSDPEFFVKDISVIHKAYQHVNADEQLIVHFNGAINKPEILFGEWIK